MNDLALWLEQLGLEQYAETFAENDVDLEMLDELSDEDLKELGLSLGHRRKLQKALRGGEQLAPAGARPSAESPPATESTSLPLTSPEAERRQLSIMFCDLAGSTELSQVLDAEELREINRAYQDVCKDAIERYEGYVARYMGDGVLAYFGYPQAHEDDAERAIFAGLQVVDSVAALGPRFERDLNVRVGIATGPVVVGDLIGEGASQESAVVGETPNLAARLQGFAPPNSVVIASSTQALAAGRFEYADLGHHALKGLAAAVRTWRVVGPSTAESRFEAARRADLTPLVGREQEIELILERWEQAKGGDGQVVLLSGEAGIGKSRIVESLRERTAGDEPVRLRYQCSPYHQNTALHPVIEQLERAGSFAPADTDEQRLDKLETLVRLGSNQGVESIVALLAPLLSIPLSGRYKPPEVSPERQKQLALEALVAQAEGLSRTRPVLFVFEDAHWADPTSLDLLELTVARVQNARVLVAITFRPEFSPPWTGYTHVTSLTLNRFTRSLAATMVDQVTGGKTLPDTVLEQIIEKTDGVPLFVEELTKTILESGLLAQEAGGYALSGLLTDLTIPTTLHDSLMERLDRLGAVKEVAQTASAIGREFDYDLLAAVSSMSFSEIRDALAQLIDAGLVFRHGRSQEDRYLFKHALVQDAAYGSLLSRTRREIHGRISEVLEARFPDRASREPVLLAHHFTEAGLPDRALPYWRQAGALASSQSAFAEAASHFGKGLEVLGSELADPVRLSIALELQIELADSLVWSRGFAAPEVEAAYGRALELCRREEGKPEQFGILWGLWHFFVISANLGRAMQLAREVYALAEASGSAGRRSQAHRALAETLFWRGDFAEARAEAERGISNYEPGPESLVPGGESASVSNRCFLSLAQWALGYPDQSLATSRDAVRAAAETHSSGDWCMSSEFVSWQHLLRCEWESAREGSKRAHEFAAERGMVLFEAFGVAHGGAAAAGLGEGERGSREVAHSLEIIDAIGASILRSWFVQLHAQSCLHAGESQQALRVLDRAFRDAEEFGVQWLLADYHRLKGAALLQMDQSNEAETALRAAIETARAQEAKSLELRACRDLARMWHERGKSQEARSLLQPVFEWFTEGLDAPDLASARALLDELPV